MGRQLKAAVIIGENVYRPGDTPSDEDAKLITNPAAWGEDDNADAFETAGPTPTGNTDGIGGTVTGNGALPAPPRSGRGSGEDAWQAWANTRADLDVAPDAKKADIIAAAEDAGLIEKQQ